MINFLNFKDCSTENDVFNRMTLISDKILHDYKLEFLGKSFDITAIEFYLHIPESNNFSFIDPFIHRNKHQLNAGTFYIHDECTRACNYSGIDITCGARDEQIYGGILIRELNGNDGSATALKSIIRQVDKPEYLRTDKWSDKEKERLFDIHGTGIFDGPLKLVPKSKTDERQIYHGKRILSITPAKAIERSPIEQIFIEKKMRFASWKTDKHKKTMELAQIDNEHK